MDFRNKFIQEAIESIEKNYHRLNDWEKFFFDNIKNLQKRGVVLSQKQYNLLINIKTKHAKIYNLKIHD